jgi:simple sugar transport system permease protein
MTNPGPISSGPRPTTAEPGKPTDERVLRGKLLDRLVARPELGSVLGAIAVFGLFSLITEQFLLGVATWLDDSATLGIMAVGVAMLMIGGEFDLSAGVMTASTALVTAMIVTQLGWNVWVALLASLLFAITVGVFNGFVVIRTGLPSFIVTLGTFFALQGLNLGVTRLITDTVQVSGISSAPGYESAGFVFASTVDIAGNPFQISIGWWIGVAVVASWLLLRTRFGNWIFAVGGSANSGRQVGVPVVRTKILLFVGTALCGWLVGTINILRFTTVQANQGVGLEFQFIIAAVIGGCLLTGGFGSAIGAAIGALIFGMVRQGIVFAQWNNDWFFLFLGALLLGAVLVNNTFRHRAERLRK